MAENRTAEKPTAVISSSACRHEFGFLGKRPKGTAFPDECFTCGKMLDCMAAKPEGHVTPPPEKKDTPYVVETRTSIVKPKQETVQVTVEEDEEPQAETIYTSAKTSDDEFTVENAGMVYAQWSSTVLINKESVEQWGKKVKEVEVITSAGKRAKCKVQPVQDAAVGVVQVPEKLQVNLGIKKGAIVKIKPVVK